MIAFEAAVPAQSDGLMKFAVLEGWISIHLRILAYKNRGIYHPSRPFSA